MEIKTCGGLPWLPLARVDHSWGWGENKAQSKVGLDDVWYIYICLTQTELTWWDFISVVRIFISFSPLYKQVHRPIK